jgi:inhibitor of KinA
VIRPFGDRALLVEAGDYKRAHALVASFDEGPIPGVVDLVPGMETVLVELDSSASAGSASAELERRLAALRVDASGGRERTIPTCYGAEHGPDLGDVARLTGLSPEEVAATHAGATTLGVQLVGFAPGFAYIGDADRLGGHRGEPDWDLPRRAARRLEGHRPHPDHPL